MAKRPTSQHGDGTPERARDGVVADHFATFRGTNGKVLVRHVFGQVVIPLVLAAIAVAYALRIMVVSELIAGFAVLAGFLFALVIFVFQLRQGVTHDPRVQTKTKLPVLIDQLFANVLYSVVVSFVLIALAVAGAVTEPHDKHGDPMGLPVWLGAMIVAVCAHLLAIVWMCIKRTRRAYRELRR